MEENDNELKKEEELKCTCKIDKKNSNISTDNCIYGLGLIGAAIYYISTATSFWVGVLGILKAIVWPAFLVFEALKFLA